MPSLLLLTLNFKKSVTCKISERSLLPSLTNIASTQAVWFDEIRKIRYFLMQFARALGRIFKSAFL